MPKPRRTPQVKHQNSHGRRLQRAYFHADEWEDHPGNYYCFACDVFIAAEHFTDDAHRNTHLDFPTQELYIRSAERYDRMRARGVAIFRPDNVYNLFATPLEVVARLTRD
jgi:hypothetical protein